MKKLILPFVAAFGLSLGGSTGLVMVRAPKATAKTAKSAAKPDAATKPDAAKTDSATKPATADSTPAATDTSVHSAVAAPTTTAPTTTAAPTPSKQNTAVAPNHATAATTTAPVTAVAPPQAKPKVVAEVKPATDTIVGRKLAQIFGAMQAKDAARVLEQMDDADVRTIISALNNKQQAAILGNFPTPRAAGIVRATLRAGSGGTQ